MPSIIDGTQRVEENGWTNVANQPMWSDVGVQVRAERVADKPYDRIDPVTAGLYMAGMMAQVEILRSNGHNWTEVANETIIEAVDSLNPYMHARGIDAMVDGCSTTARLGARKWAPRFDAVIAQGVLPVLSGSIKYTGEDHFAEFANHPVHDALKKCSDLRPAINIAVQ